MQKWGDDYKLYLNTSTPACHATLGWLSIEACIDLVRLTFLLKLLQLTSSNIYNILTVARLTDLRFGLADQTLVPTSGPITVLYNTARKYGLADHVHAMLDSVTTRSNSMWRKLVTDRVSSRYSQRWTMTSLLYKKPAALQTYSSSGGNKCLVVCLS